MASAGDAGVSLGPWYTTGPIGAERFTDTFFPELGVDVAATGEDGGALWKKRDDWPDGNAHRLPGGNNVMTYLFRSITSPADRKEVLKLGSDDGIVVWLNGNEILRHDIHRGLAPDQEQVILDLKRGENRLLMKIFNGGGPHGFYFDLSIEGGEDLWDRFAAEFPVHADWLVRNATGAHRRCFNSDDGALPLAAVKGALKEIENLTSAVRHLSGAFPSKYARGEEFLARIGDVTRTLAGVNDNLGYGNVDHASALRAVDEYVALRRDALFANPLLDFKEILFLKKHFLPGQEGLGNHMCDQYFGFHALRGGGLFALSNAFSAEQEVRDVLRDSVCENGRFEGKDLKEGGFLSPDLSYDARQVLFAWTEGEQTRYKWTERSTYHLFRVNADGTGLTQLTDGAVNDFDPCWMPSGRVVFISERRGGYGRCHGRPVPTYTLHAMNADGSDIVCLSYHETNEWHPSIDNDGMVVYTRWDYVDRGFNQAHHPWITTPDGRDARAIQGNFAASQSARPHMEMDVRAIPNSRKLIATAAGHHAQAYGSLVVIDPAVEDDDAMAPLTRLTPEARFPEAEISNREGQLFANAWPLSECFYLCVHDPEGSTERGPKNNYGIYVIDAFGNRDLIYRDPDISCSSPIPLRPRKRPPVIPHMTAVGRPGAPAPAEDEDPPQTSTVGLVNVYDSLKPLPENVKILSLRIVQVLPKTTPHANGPRIGYGDQKNARAVLGTVPVESDGSAFFTLPAGKPVYFQALGADGLAVQSMRSDTYTHPGERLVCQGCHQPRHRAPRQPSSFPLAMRRAPSEIQPDVEGSKPFSFPRLVQPVLEKNCVACHSKSDKAPDLGKGAWEKHGNRWYTSYVNLREHAFYFDNAVFTVPRTTPGKFGARASKLYRMLEGGHHELELSAEDLHRIGLWLDCNSDFFGAYENIDAQSRGEEVQPSLE